MTLTLAHADYWDLFQAVQPDPGDRLGLRESYPSQLGQGYRYSNELRPGLELAVSDSCLKDDLVMTHRDRVHPLEYTFDQFYPAGKTQQRYSLCGSGLAPGEPWFVPGNTRIVSVNVHIEPVVFRQWLGLSEQLPVGLKPFMRSPDEKYYEHSGTPTAAMQMTVQQILTCPFQGMTQRLYLESKVWELMALLIEAVRPSQPPQTSAHRLKPDDVERIHYASKILRQRLLNPPSLMELARAVGINDHKLKVGFRQVFDTTVFGYLHELRMARSHQLLERGEMNVTAAAHAVGFANRGHFAAAFRRRYGVNPGMFMRQRRA
ncbi:helix-turn-helix transcriptional regulator [Romeria aff. gracilis LEGE 07310]|uniref:Helix-turn-helix transcriptional regulator n=1 Tax=Vasconcelosia minhoensis LEGE 07310 TaxID=915328 RepID=A0A8J7DK24_9CYAN|nr:AraC family transcriptional regulator [Romeria gracilis]MBE9075846.1 helix-turn-helix transcriptional regulator [Romeria aff. gracilis LEGE 07310]